MDIYRIASRIAQGKLIMKSKFEHAGFPCEVWMNYEAYPTLHLGYVIIPEGHPMHGKYGDYIGGEEITFSRPESELPTTNAMRKIPRGNGWVFGIDSNINEIDAAKRIKKVAEDLAEQNTETAI